MTTEKKMENEVPSIKEIAGVGKSEGKANKLAQDKDRTFNFWGIMLN